VGHEIGICAQSVSGTELIIHERPLIAVVVNHVHPHLSEIGNELSRNGHLNTPSTRLPPRHCFPRSCPLVRSKVGVAGLLRRDREGCRRLAIPENEPDMFREQDQTSPVRTMIAWLHLDPTIRIIQPRAKVEPIVVEQELNAISSAPWRP